MTISNRILQSLGIFLLLILISSFSVSAQSAQIGVEDRDVWSFQVKEDSIPNTFYPIGETDTTLTVNDTFLLTITENPRTDILEARIDTAIEVLRLNQSMADLASYVIYTDWTYWIDYLGPVEFNGVNYTVVTSDGADTMSFELTPVETNDITSLFLSYFKETGVMNTYLMVEGEGRILIENTTGSDAAGPDLNLGLITVIIVVLVLLWQYRRMKSD